MTRIKSIQQLNTRKKHLLYRRTELEKLIHCGWIDLRNSANPKNLAGKIFASENKPGEEQVNSPFFAEILSKLAATLTSKLARKAEARMYKWFKR